MNNLSETLNPAVTTLEHWSVEFIRLLPHIVLAILALIFFIVLGRLLRKKIRPYIQRASAQTNSSQLAENIGSQLVFYACILIGLLIAASILGLDKIFASALTGLGVFGLALGYAFKDVAANFFAGIVINLREPFKAGDYIQVSDYHGYVVATDLLYTTVRTTDGQLVFAPNQTIYSQPVFNFSSEGERRVVLSTGVSYGDDLSQVRELAIKTIKEFEFLKEGKPIDLYFTDIGGSSYNFDLRYWIEFDSQTQFRHAMSEGIIRLKEAFDEADISIPYPVQTLDFGVKGGVNLSETHLIIDKE